MAKNHTSSCCSCKPVNSSTPAQMFSVLFLLQVSYYSELCSPLTSCQTTLVGRKEMDAAFLPGTDGVFALTDGH